MSTLCWPSHSYRQSVYHENQRKRNRHNTRQASRIDLKINFEARSLKNARMPKLTGMAMLNISAAVFRNESRPIRVVRKSIENRTELTKSGVGAV